MGGVVEGVPEAESGFKTSGFGRFAHSNGETSINKACSYMKHISHIIHARARDSKAPVFFFKSTATNGNHLYPFRPR